MLSGYFIRWRAWWFNKVPLSVTTVLLLADGGHLTVAAMLALVLVVLTVCAVGNYGYALNDLYDIEEDARAGRANAAAQLGVRRTTAIVIASTVAAVLLGGAAARWIGAVATLAAVVLPFLYSVPPFRFKERTWLGVVADGLAAHVYPAVLAMAAAAHLGVRSMPAVLIFCLLAWAAAVGLRGILSHQLHTTERDRAGGLTTVVHHLGSGWVDRLIVFVLLPIEAAAFIGAALLCSGGPVLWALGALYLAAEGFRTLDGGFSVTVLQAEGRPYVPFVEESFYKAWGPVVIALDAARMDLRFLALIPVYVFLFRPHLSAERKKLLAIRHAILRRFRPG